MFNSNFDITGVHANYLKDLCELRGNVSDKDQHNNFKIFKAYIDAYILCPLIGYQYGRKGKMGSAADGEVGILAEQIIKRSGELKYVYQILMLVDEESEPDVEKRIYRSFNFSEKTDEDKAMLGVSGIYINKFKMIFEKTNETDIEPVIEPKPIVYEVIEGANQTYMQNIVLFKMVERYMWMM